MVGGAVTLPGPNRLAALVAAVAVATALAGAAGCGADAVPVQREARVLARTCASLLERSTGTVPASPVPDAPFVPALRSEAGRRRDRTQLAAMVDVCHRFGPPPATRQRLVIAPRSAP